jgi:hypothetical protein
MAVYRVASLRRAFSTLDITYLAAAFISLIYLSGTRHKSLFIANVDLLYGAFREFFKGGTFFAVYTGGVNDKPFTGEIKAGKSNIVEPDRI